MLKCNLRIINVLNLSDSFLERAAGLLNEKEVVNVKSML